MSFKLWKTVRFYFVTSTLLGYDQNGSRPSRNQNLGITIPVGIIGTINWVYQLTTNVAQNFGINTAMN